VRAAILNSGFEFPPGRITVNLAPVELAKEGGRFDLPIALGLLLASGQLQSPPAASVVECYGELGLSGELKTVSGLFLAAVHAARANNALVVPAGNLAEVRAAGHRHAVGLESLRQAGEALAGASTSMAAGASNPAIQEATARQIVPPVEQNDPFDAIKGQWRAKRALTIAATGGHSVLMIGPPGSGKTLLASRLPALLPPMDAVEAMEVASIASIGDGQFNAARWGCRPFRSPHHSASASAIVGGGSRLSPGEISLAHRGVLFLDELPEFDRRVLEALREPLENGCITLARASGRLELPARFQLIAAMNPCPCGHLGDDVQACRCSPRRIERYRSRISGPLLDRIDLRIEVPRVPLAELQAQDAATEAANRPCNQRVRAARELQLRRAGCLNAHLPLQRLQQDCALDSEAQRLLDRSCEQLGLSGRGLHRLLRVSRSIADLDGAASINAGHLAEAIQLRRPLPSG
jgi:magnesium chelatase family protein